MERGRGSGQVKRDSLVGGREDKEAKGQDERGEGRAAGGGGGEGEKIEESEGGGGGRVR